MYAHVMALQRIRIDWARTPGTEDQKMAWSWGVSGPVVDAADVADAFAGNAHQLRGLVSAQYRTVQCSVFPAEGGPATSAVAMSAVGGVSVNNQLYPPQCAIAVNALVSTNLGDRPKGRTFYGGFTTSGSALLTADGRPAVTGINYLLTGCVQWHNLLVGMGLAPVVLAGDGLSHRGAIVAYQTDNSWDTMRSRKFERTQMYSATP